MNSVAVAVSRLPTIQEQISFASASIAVHSTPRDADHAGNRSEAVSLYRAAIAFTHLSGYHRFISIYA